MADDDGAKGLKALKDGVIIAETAVLRGRIEQPWTGQPSADNGHEHDSQRDKALPGATIVATTKVDLSRVDTDLVTCISSFLGTSLELLNLALTCKSFGWRQPTTTLNWSLVEEVARHAVCSRATDDEMDCLPQYTSGTMTWLSVLYRYEHLLDFDVLLGCYIEHRNGDKTTVRGTGHVFDSSVAVSSNCVMKSGVHIAKFLITGEPYIGIVRPMPGLDAGAYQEEFDFFDDNIYPDFRAQISSDWDSDVHACDFSCGNGKVAWTDWEDSDHADGKIGKGWNRANQAILLVCC
ncbi:hypothetical protein THAOC_04216 [Thalassiosira oceanica]|uniref:F-box domain-containing protein n=1 Tax=Thalassiosira oceanica TaxID=159749 RepID=K0TP45_THAOC|nr:hypothetical protein THAOC_04216 [Thalassiosira oceanica]|eukprot:EJK74127.1 hypothetical protein THAOC_04216 [Thalassiosira oceanica]